MEFNRYIASLLVKGISGDDRLIPRNHHVPSSSPVQVHVSIVCTTIKRLYLRRPIGNPYRLRSIGERQRTQQTHQCLEAGTFKSFEATHETVKDSLTSLQIEDQFHDYVSKKVLRWGRIVLGRESNAGRKVIPLIVEIKSVRTYVMDEREWIFQRALIRSMEESNNNCAMVPASKSSVRGLKRKRLTSSDRDDEDCKESKVTCTICFEDLPKGAEVTCMPCSHMFHQDCIVTWLKESHFCPICRFELPTDSKLDPEARGS